ncbi:hypothetical protein ABZ837_16120 [Streptomyces sp. NPDC047197]|uniref:hypothetical protein n=1 Tax=Streptomyces sp. NPDC047197 TaxID=3155477 RepID=UPI0033CCC657
MNDPWLVAQLLAVHGPSRSGSADALHPLGPRTAHSGLRRKDCEAPCAGFNTFNNDLGRGADPAEGAGR